MWCQLICMMNVCGTHWPPVVWWVPGGGSVVDWCGLVYQHLPILCIVLNGGNLASLVATVSLIRHIRVDGAASTVILVQILHFSLRREQS